MSFVLAAIRAGHDPVGKLPDAAFHRYLEQQLHCPKCDAVYNLVCDYQAAVGRHFEEESRRPLMMLRKAIMQGHRDGHLVAHFETAGVVVTSFSPPSVPAETASQPRPSNVIQPLRPAMGRPF